MFYRKEDSNIRIQNIFRPLNPRKIILFGSLARGDWDEESDLDLVIFYDADRLFLERLKEQNLICDMGKAVDIHAHT